MDAQRRTQYAQVVAEAEAKAAKHAADRDALDKRSRSYAHDYIYLTHLMDSQQAKADRHRRLMEDEG